MNTQFRLLMVQSSADSLANYRRMLENAECEIITATSTEQALQLIREQDFAVVVTGFELPSSSGRPGGIEILSEVQRLNLSTQTVVITANTQQDAKQSLHYGAFSYLQRPVDEEILILTVQKAYEEYNQLFGTAQHWAKDSEAGHQVAQDTIEPLLGNSRLTLKMLSRIDALAREDGTVLFVGESGVGKALTASHIYDKSQRRGQPFGVLDCRHLKRLQQRVYFEILRYRDGVLVLDNIHAVSEDSIAYIPEIIQRALPLNIRLLMTTHYGLEGLSEVYESLGVSVVETFPENIQVIWIPPLRERQDGDDLEALAVYYLNYYAQDQIYPMQFSSDAIQYIKSMDFVVGNVRELRNLVFAVAQATYEKGERAISQQTIDDYVDKVSRESRPIQVRQIFVSHSSRDKEFVVRLLKELESEYLDFWIDHERIPFGSPAWFDEIDKGLERSDAMLLVVSPDAMVSDEVKSEWDYFLRKKRTILPLIYKPVDNMNYRLQKLQSITYSDDNSDRIRDAIISILRNPY